MGQTKEPILSTISKIVRLMCVLAAIYFVVRCIDAGSQDDDIVIKETPVVIESIKPIGELYAYTAITEDFAIDNVEKIGFFSRNYYKAVQTLRMQVSYIIDLDSVDYLPQQGTDTVLVRLPRPRYVQSGQGGNFLCEIEADDYDAAKAIGIVEQKIKSKYDTPDNRAKALAHAKEVLTTFVLQCGLIPKCEEK